MTRYSLGPEGSGDDIRFLRLVVKLPPRDPFSRYFVAEAQFDLREIKFYTEVRKFSARIMFSGTSMEQGPTMILNFVIQLRSGLPQGNGLFESLRISNVFFSRIILGQ